MGVGKRVEEVSLEKTMLNGGKDINEGHTERAGLKREEGKNSKRGRALEGRKNT